MKYFALLPLAILLAGCGQSTDSTSSAPSTTLKDTYSASSGLEEPKFESPKEGDEVGVITTTFGKMVIKFRPDLAPKTVDNFKKLASKGFYDHTIFHRIIPGFMIQGGDPLTKDKSKITKYGPGDPGDKLPDEFNNLDHKRGVVSMAHAGAPDSGGSQFFICVADSGDNLNRKYAAFGEVISGLDVADQIVTQPRNTTPMKGPTDKPQDLPNSRIEMTVKIEKWPVK